MKHTTLISTLAAAGLFAHAGLAEAQTATTTTTTTTAPVAPAVAPTTSAADGKAPAEVKAVVGDVKVADAPALAKPTAVGSTITLAAGGMMSTGNSRAQSLTANAAYTRSWTADTLGFSAIGNYTEAAKTGEGMAPTVQNMQVKARYDRLVSPKVSVFAQASGLHDKFQGLDMRFNVDPGVRYNFIADDVSALWGEAGADIQYDIRNNKSVYVDGDAKTKRFLGEPISSSPSTTEITKTATDYSARLYAGYRRALNANVTFFTGLEYLQSLQFFARSRLNWDAVVAAKLTDGLSLGVGFKVRYDNQPLPGKESTDTATTVQVIYAFSDTAKK